MADFQHGGANDGNDIGHYEDNQGLVYCIQLTPSLLRYTDGRCPFREILESLNELMNSLVITLPDTGVGCYLFNCAGSEVKGENTTKFKTGIYELFPLGGLDVENMKRVHDLLQDNLTNHSSFSEKFPILDPSNKNTSEQLNNMLNAISWDSGKRYIHKKAFLFTDYDKPFAKNLQSKLALKETARNFNRSYKIGQSFYTVSLHPFFINSRDKAFDTTEYTEILQIQRHPGQKVKEEDFDSEDELYENDDSENELDLTSLDLESIKAKVSQLRMMKRFAFKFPLTVLKLDGGSIVISLKGYSIFSSNHTKPATEYVSDDDHLKPVESSQGYFKENGAKIDEVQANRIINEFGTRENQLVSAFKLGSQYIPFLDKKEQPGQLERLRALGAESDDPAMEILGYRSIDRFMPHLCLRAPHFIVPDLNGNTHSRRTYDALHQTLVSKKKFAIIWGKPRGTAHLSLYALLPSTHKETSFSKIPEGLLLFKLPFKDDVRAVPKLNPSFINEDLSESLESMKKIVKELETSYDPANYPNPSLNWHFKILRDQIFQETVSSEYYKEGISLEKAHLLETSDFDLTKQKVKAVKERIHAASVKVEDEDDFSIDGLSWMIMDINLQTSKLPGYLKTLKKPKPEAIEVPDRDMKEAWRAQMLETFKVDQLKRYCKDKGLGHTGKKQDLIANISDYLSIQEDALLG
ncbi:unnamed protein product [Kuraishia capsulata CBS 1993]|uniref:ATP-dependent DNA helicase II subunit 1 n=1 Tax=Kuraishia capsulata CBS 1993 TaxID=1382522 RepID=W6MQG7_9ASCO|nr:uncharacterized protein KUCA_T00004541001 [Kuraishia capsulata CBS 1993]CDK28558.1 unnamed protein product [Kuraishia capsulata CBS 1993]